MFDFYWTNHRNLRSVRFLWDINGLCFLPGAEHSNRAGSCLKNEGTGAYVVKLGSGLSLGMRA
jgi:hypothetical protein